LSLIAYFHDAMFHITLVHSPLLNVSHDYVFMSMYGLYGLWVF